MHSKHPECLGSDPYDGSLAASVRLRDEPDEDEEDDEEEDEGKEKQDEIDDDDEDAGYLV